MTVTTNYLVTGNGITGSTANAVQSLVSGYGNSFSPATDGTADDSAAVVSALTAAMAAGGVLKFTAGKTYTFRNLRITAPVTIDATGATIQYGGSYGTTAPLESVPVILYGDGTVGTPIPNITIIGGTWKGNRAAGIYDNLTVGAMDALQFDYCPNTLITGARFVDISQDAVTFSNSAGSSVTGCVGEDIADSFVEFRAGGGYIVRGNRATRVRHLVACKPNISDAVVDGNYASTFRQGIVGHGTDWTIANNVIDVYTTPDSIDGNQRAGIEWSDFGGLVTPVDTYRCTITGNTVKDRTAATGILLAVPSTAHAYFGVTINGNTVKSRRAIHAAQGSRVTISGNTAEGGTQGAIYADNSASADITISNNVCSGTNSTASGVISVDAPGAMVSGNTVRTATAAVLGVHVTANAVGATIQGNTVATTTGIAIQLTAIRSKAIGNNVSSTTAVAVRADVAGCAVSQNSIVTTAAAAISTLSAGTSLSAVGNTITAVGGEGFLLQGVRASVSGNVITSATQGVRVSASNCSVTGNTITGCQFWGVNVSAGAVDTLVVGNNLVGNTSGALTDAGTTTTAANNKP